MAVEGTPFGRYRLLGLVGQGAMGEVYRAQDTERHRVVALKLLTDEAAADANYQERFRREARTTARLREPHVIPIHDFGEIDGRLYLDMRLIDGDDLRTVIARHGRLSPAQAVGYITQAADALDAAHAENLVHRDVKPSNLLVTERDFVYLIDFGIAHDGRDTSLTRTGTAVGTLTYMAPERFTTGVAGPRSDIYSLACVLQECLTGLPPYPGSSLEQQIAGHLTTPPPRPSESDPAIPPALDAVIARGMAKKPDERFATAGELATAARRAVEPYPGPAGFRSGTRPDHELESGPHPGPPTAEPPQHRSRLAFAILGVLLAIGIVLASALVVYGRGDRPAATVAAAVPTTSVSSPPTFAQMNDFVRAFYAKLPTQRDQAWSDFDAHYANRMPRSDFDDFWESMQTVTVLTVQPRDATSVIARLTYVPERGGATTEDRWLSFVVRDGRLYVYDSDRIGTV